MPHDRLLPASAHFRQRDESTDFAVVGTGVAGLTAALSLSRLGSVRLLTKSTLGGGCTPLAQGGIACASAPDDCAEQHARDTVTAGCGLTDEAAARTATTAAPSVLQWLADCGVVFDQGPDGLLRLGREGGHLRHRIAHAGGDATGAAISAALVAAVRGSPGITLVEHAFFRDVLLDVQGQAAGVLYEQAGGEVRLASRAVILATGGYAGLFPVTTNPAQLTADGVACALRAGAELCDMEFVQFHPTALWAPGHGGQLPLVSEAVRGEGGRLVDRSGRAIMDGVHRLGDLAPRDVVARTIALRLREDGADHVLLDARHLGAKGWASRFPTIRAHCLSHGIDPSDQPIPVAPAAHYTCGGIRTDLAGRTSLPGLYACGEAACTGLHGANRLASNSLLEGVVFAHRVAAHLTTEPPPRREPAGPPRSAPLLPAAARKSLRVAAAAGGGILRCHDQLCEALNELEKLPTLPPGPVSRADRETSNLHLVALAMLLSALHRTESRGSHHRTDYPTPDGTRAPGHSLIRHTPDGLMVLDAIPLRARRRSP